MADLGSPDLPRNAPASVGEASNKREGSGIAAANPSAAKKKARASRDAAATKRRCVSTACIACRKRKSKCDGNSPRCAACSSVYGTECVYDPGSDHRRKGVYKDKTENLKARETTLQTIIQAILNYDEDDVPALVRQIRSSESLDEVADSIIRRQVGEHNEDDDEAYESAMAANPEKAPTTFEDELSGKMGELRLENGTVRFIGGTSNLIYLAPEKNHFAGLSSEVMHTQNPEGILSWTKVTQNEGLIKHLLNMYLMWHYPFFTCLSRSLFMKDFLLGRQPVGAERTSYCSSLLANAMLALGCHFTTVSGACSDPTDPATKGDHFFAEAKRLIVENDEYEKPRLTTVQALCLMSVREAGCGREAKGWVYSGMSFRMGLDMGLNLDITTDRESMDEKEVDARRVTFWGCFLFDKCWSNYLGRLPQLPSSNVTVPKIEVFPDEEADYWAPYTDQGLSNLHKQPARTRAVALQITALCQISSDLLSFFYHPTGLDRPMGKGVELKRLGELHTRLETWRRDLPMEFDIKEGQLPNVLVMHMFNHLLYIHLFRPFLKYSPERSPLPSHVSPRKLCTAAAASISKIMRQYKRAYGLRQICNIAVYIVHSACTIHLLNLPLADVKSECALDDEGNGTDGKGKSTTASQQVGKAARRDIVHGVKHLEEIAEDWLCARRTLSILYVLARKWKIELPEEARLVLERTDRKYGTFNTGDVPSSSPSREETFGYEGPQRTSPLGPRPDEEGVEFGGDGGAGCDRGRFGGMRVGDMVQVGFADNGFGLHPQSATQLSSPYETNMGTPTMGQQSVMGGQSPAPFGQDAQFANYMRFSPKSLAAGMQNPQQPNILHNSSHHQSPSQQMGLQTQQSLQQQQQQQHMMNINVSSIQQPLPPSPFNQFQHHYSTPMSATSAPHTPNLNLANLTPGPASLHGTPVARQMSPGVFGGVELGAGDVTSQDWWLRDQAQIAVGFEGWGGRGGGGGGVGIGNRGVGTRLGDLQAFGTGGVEGKGYGGGDGEVSAEGGDGMQGQNGFMGLDGSANVQGERGNGQVGRAQSGRQDGLAGNGGSNGNGDGSGISHLGLEEWYGL